MKSLCSLAALAALTTVAAAQSPLCTIQPFLSNNGGSAGGITFFDLQVNVQVNITSMDVNYSVAAGGAVGIQVYTIAGTYLGNEQNMGAWTLAGQDNGSATAAGLDLPTSITLQNPIVLAPGNYGVACVAIGSGHSYTNGTGANQNFSNAEMSISLGAAQNVPFTGTPFTPRVMNTCIYYTVGTGFATATPFGDACGAGDPASIYEIFDGTTSINDLSNFGGLTAVFTGSTYAVTPGAPAIVPPSPASNLALTDDQIVQVTLPWPLPTPSGPVNDIYVCSNGFVTLEPYTGTDFGETVGGLLSGPARIPVIWDDLNPAAAGSVHAEQDPTSPGLFHVTWDQVTEFGATNSNTAQLTFQIGGSYELKFGALAMLDGMTGYSPGNGATDPGVTDLTGITNPILLGDDRPNVTLASVARPVIGTTGMIQTQDIPTGSTLGFLMFGFARVPAPGFALGVIGMPGCFQHVVGDVTTQFTPTGTTENHSLAIPINPALAGGMLFAQSVIITPGINVFGAVSTNGMEWVLDIN